MDAVIKEIAKLEKSATYDKCLADVDRLIFALEDAQARIQADPQSAHSVVKALSLQVDQVKKAITQDEKEVYGSIGKFGKSLERTFKGNTPPETSRFDKLEPTRNLINRAIVMYLTRSGEFDVASTFMGETGVNVPDDLLDEFSKMYVILQHIQSQDLGPAIEWATSKRKELLARGSNLEFSLHRLQFIHYLLEEHNQAKAIQYARQHFSKFKDRYFKETSRLMNTILYTDNIEDSPYVETVSFPTYDQLHIMFASEFCSLLGFPPQSPLYLAVTAGSIAIPVLSKMESVRKQKGTGWSTVQELPVNIDLPEIFQFHSVFVCPVSKEQTTEKNPPMMLPCGHILAKESVRSLGKDSPTHMFKCPYCPMDTNYSQAKEVYF